MPGGPVVRRACTARGSRVRCSVELVGPTLRPLARRGIRLGRPGVARLSSVFAASVPSRAGQGQPRGVAQLGSALRSGRRGRRFKSCHPDSWLKGPDLRERVQGPSAIPASGMTGVGAQGENVADSRWGRRFHVDTGLRFADRLEDPKPPHLVSPSRLAVSTMTNEVLSKYSWRAASAGGLQQQAHPAAPSPHLLGTHPLPGMATSVPHQPQATHLPGRAWSTPFRVFGAVVSLSLRALLPGLRRCHPPHLRSHPCRHGDKN